jgi:hypothetical protein
MTKIERSRDCGNSPKNLFAEDFTIALLTGDRDFVARVATAEFDPGGQPPAELVLDHVVTHGKAGAVNGKIVAHDGRCEGFCLVLTFASAKADRVSRVQFYRA